LIRIVGSLIVLFVCCTVLGCGDPPPSKYPPPQDHVEDTTLAPGDVFEVRVYQQEEMTNKYRVTSAGTISFPLIGMVQVAGKTPAEVESDIRDRLADGYLRNPQVSLLVSEFGSQTVSVFGEVQRPGTLKFSNAMTIIDAISQAGGLTPMAKKNAVTVTRVEDGKKRKYTVPVEDIGKGKALNFQVRPGDVVYVPERIF
jgi:polysaccharide export outer membrane protein